jgi:[protein-PII] uridylyltransferase
VHRALGATWRDAAPHADLERSRAQLLDIRDLVQAHAGRATDRITPETWSALAEGLGLPDEQQAQRRLREIGRRTTHLARLTWSRVDRVLAPDTNPARGVAPRLERLAPGVALSADEVVLERRADPAKDPLLLLRAAAVAAERGLMLSPPSAARLARAAAPLPEPWPQAARDLLVRLLASGPGLLPVWETLDETGALDRLLPEWQRIRLLPHASAVHRFTVDRHVVETCVEASRLIRRVGRPDLLLVAALLHDIGKGALRDHSVAGEPVAAAVATRMGFSPGEVAMIAALVRHHLLLAETATKRDIDDPATVALVCDRLGTREMVDLLAVLSEADARAASPQAWSAWRATLVGRLADRVRAALAGQGSPREAEDHDREPEVPAEAFADPSYLSVQVEPSEDGSRVRVVAHDRVGLMADVAGALLLSRTGVRAARAWTVDGVAVSDWEVPERGLDPAILTQRIGAVLGGTADPAARIRPPREALPPAVLVHPSDSREATVLEVRTEDVAGVVYRVCRTLAALDLSVRSAHVTTIGPQTTDVFYVQEPGAGPLTDERAATAVHAIRTALEGAATLDA